MLAAHADIVALYEPEDLTVHVRIDGGCWHKKAIGGHTTACGMPINYRTLIGLRQETYVGLLCADCFTEFELDKSRVENQRLWEDAT